MDTKKVRQSCMVLGMVLTVSLVISPSVGAGPPHQTQKFSLKNLATLSLETIRAVPLDDLTRMKSVMQQTKQNPPRDEITLITLAKLYFHYAWQVGPRREALSAARTCQNLLEGAVARESQNAGVHLWYALCHGLRAARGDIFAGLAAKDIMFTHLNKAQVLDPNLENGAIQLTLAELYHRLPTMMGGDRQHARELLEAVVQRFPQNVMAWVCLADFYREEGDIAKARDLYLVALNTNPGPNMTISKRMADKRALSALQEVGSRHR